MLFSGFWKTFLASNSWPATNLSFKTTLQQQHLLREHFMAPLSSAPTAAFTYPQANSYHTALQSSMCVSVSPATVRVQKASPSTQTLPGTVVHKY